MANVQKQFEEFDSSIRLGRFDENATLREKRDIVRRKVDARLPEIFALHGETLPQYEWDDHGSYDLGTGIKPQRECDFDIDQGLHFEIAHGAYDPVTLKKRIREALDGHTDEVRVRRPCVTVQYHLNGEPAYHVDIAVFSDATANADSKTRLAIGRETSPVAEREWSISDPTALKDAFWTRFPAGPDRQQFRRVVRYLKRWKDHNFLSDGNAAPTGISMTVAAHNDLGTVYDDILTKDSPNDLEAMRRVVGAMLLRFTPVWDQSLSRSVRRLAIRLPVEPWSDLVEKMSGGQMVEFESRLLLLKGALDDAFSSVDPVEASRKLQRVFGPDFPVPERKETARKNTPAVVSSSNSA